MRKYSSLFLALLVAGCANSDRILMPPIERNEESLQEYRKEEEKPRLRRERFWRNWRELENEIYPYTERSERYT